MQIAAWQTQMSTSFRAQACANLTSIQKNKVPPKAEILLFWDTIMSLFVQGKYKEGENTIIQTLQAYKKGLSNAQFKSIKLPNIDLNNANLNSCVIDNVHLQNSNLYKANLKNSKIDNVDFSNAYLTCTDFSKSEIYNTEFKKTSIHIATLTSTNIYNSSLNNLHIDSTNFNNSSISKSSFSNSHIKTCNFSDSVLTGTSFYNSTLEDTMFFNTIAIHSDFKNTNFISPMLDNATIIFSDMRNATFTETYTGSTNNTENMVNSLLYAHELTATKLPAPVETILRRLKPELFKDPQQSFKTKLEHLWSDVKTYAPELDIPPLPWAYHYPTPKAQPSAPDADGAL